MVRDASRRSGRSYLRPILVGWALVASTGGVGAQVENAGPAEEKLRALLRGVAEPEKHYLDDAAVGRGASAARYAALRREQLAGQWFAALVSTGEADAFRIMSRFPSRADLQLFLRGREAVVEVWTYAPGGEAARRLTARELSERASELNPAPTFLTATYPDPSTGAIQRVRVEFGSLAAVANVREAERYRRHREKMETIRTVLGARNEAGQLSAHAQWQALRKAAREGRLPVSQLAEVPGDDRDVFVACECEVDGAGQIRRVIRAWRASEISHRIVGGADGLFLRAAEQEIGKVAVAVRQGEGAGRPIPGRDVIEVRIRDERQRDPKRWNLLEFGEAWVLRESGLAQLGLINAHLENQRRELAWRKSNLDRFAEPVFSGLNIWGGVTGAGTPWGEAARLVYNVVVTRALTPDVPSEEELKGLFRFVAAKSRHPRLGRVPGNRLSAEEAEELWQAGARMSDRDVEDAIRALNEDDFKAMLAFPQWQNLDQKYRLFVDVLTDLLKVTGESESGLLKEIFNNSRIAPNGELSITTIMAVALGARDITPLSGVSLEQLADGEGPNKAWLQYLNVTVDIRAIANTLSLLTKRGEKDRELRKPFGHAPRLNDLAAYEIRLFGYPTLFWYKRGLLKQDLEAFRNDFAYGIEGTQVVVRFATQSDFERELRAGHLSPIGFVRIPEGLRRAGPESNLPVFGFRIPSGRHAGKTAIVIYGLKAYRSHAAFMNRELERFRKYERMLAEGGVITKMLDTAGSPAPPSQAFEPRLAVGGGAVEREFKPLLQDLLEYRRLALFARWNVELSGKDLAERERLAASLRGRGVAVDSGSSSPLEEVDPFFSSFVYRAVEEGSIRRVKVIHIPGAAELARGITIAREQRRREAVRRDAAGGR